ncbi:G-type lectin S-receptor-like serine/threonine-protein kinase At1g61550 isoform X2 [Coffea arabica]|uniref:Receptor-like serine/threonine-protein kinase n=1 Tax=Coffea arabica TaxID=13443 RepID=A0A6P6VR34_COFAR|nr:G-type lectin S-receptor-like serine/threonine-protein kinase At1g61550 isoform X2 [Coffea arabica]XP_027105106.1 G-type lectin S-receptor-like serine/threonine-protein kinase At1g61550 isoform X2 [Coffea arabica]
MGKYRDIFSLSFLVLFNILFILPACCASNDTITPSQPLKVGQTLISAGQIFELGFFSPDNSSGLYVGIWYKIGPDRRIVWVANKGNALLASDLASRLIISSDGNLKVEDGKQNSVWSTNASVSSNSFIAVLQDDGNFILKDNLLGATLWESFSDPSDTLVATMPLGCCSRSGQKLFLTAWQSENDPAPGKFVVGLSDDKPAQLFTWNGTKPYWRSGPWAGWKFIGAVVKDYGYGNEASLTQNNQRGTPSLTFTLFNKPYISNLVISPTGVMKVMHKEGQNEPWKVHWAAIQTPCDVYGACGPFSACSSSGSPTCECLKGFFPLSNEEWSKGNWTSGCLRRTELICTTNSSNLTSKASKPDGFWKLIQMKLPDHHLFLYNEDAQGCSQWCLSNCSCLAYAYPDGIGCMVWVTELVDIRQLSYGGEDLYLRVANSELGVKRRYTEVIISCVAIAVGFLLVVSICRVQRWKAKRRVMHTDTHLNEQNSETRNWCTIKGFRKNCRVVGLLLSGTTREDIKEGPASARGSSSELSMIDINVIKIATNNFSEANKLGEGGFGAVYKGKLEDGQQIAVKRLSSHAGQGMEEFKNEVILVSKLQHRNLVRLLGCCIQGLEKIVILEYLKNRSLDTFLFDRTKRLELDWAKRFSIIQGIARGLLYLHRDSCLRIIHRDLKASNILLDDDMNPKISDFGLARTFRVTQELANTRRVVGTFGYMSPEYAMSGQFSEKSDVYSFGVLLLEIVSSKKNTGFGYHEKYLNLLGCAWQLWNECKALELLDQSLADSCTPTEVKRCIQIGLLCVQDHAADRPTMSNVVLMLSSSESEMELPQPRQPTFTFQNLQESDRFQSAIRLCNGSINEISISMVQGR